MQLFCEKKIIDLVKFSSFCVLLKFQKSRQTELYLAHHRVPRGMGIATWHDVM